MYESNSSSIVNALVYIKQKSQKQIHTNIKNLNKIKHLENHVFRAASKRKCKKLWSQNHPRVKI